MHAVPLDLAEPGSGGPRTTSGIRKSAMIFGLYYWTAVFVLSSIVWAMVGTDPWVSAPGKLAHYTLCSALVVGISIGMFYWHRWLIRKRRPEECLLYLFLGSFMLALAAAPLWAGLGFATYTVFIWPERAVFDLKDFGYDMVYGSGLMFGWAALFVNLLFASELSERAGRLAAVREEALEAQMRAFRYQVNPHFLFNTLNSIGGLIEEGEAAQAERMVLSLSAFLRTTLTLDPFNDVTLSEELAIQNDYLAIEQGRFSDRMRTSFNIEDEANNVLVPSLILQPLIENAIKHGVGATKGKVEIRLSAYRKEERLCVVIENDMPMLPADRKTHDGTGTGLRNVSERLRARFQEQGVLRFGPIDGHRYVAAIELPWRTP